MEAEATSRVPVRPRKRITKACDQCNASRSKCDGDRPCARCREVAAVCTFDRVSRRHGRVSKTHHSKHSFTGGASTSSRERSVLPNGPPTGNGLVQIEPQPTGSVQNTMQTGTAQIKAFSSTPSAWFANETSYGDMYGEYPATWLNDL